MISYRKAKVEEYARLRDYCLSKKIGFPDSPAIVFIAEDETGNVVGVSAVVNLVAIEPLVADNSISAKILGEKAMGVASTATSEVIALVKGTNFEFVSALEKDGFIVNDKNMTLLRKGV